MHRLGGTGRQPPALYMSYHVFSSIMNGPIVQYRMETGVKYTR